MYPLLQEHVKEPAVLVQTWVQLCDPDVHSFISENGYILVLFGHTYSFMEIYNYNSK